MKKLLFVLLGLMALAVGLVVAALVILGGSARSSAPTGGTLLLRLDQALADYAPSPVVPFFDLEPDQSLARIYAALRRARKDDGVDGLAVYIDSPRMSLAQAQELRRLMASLTEAGKSVSCYLEGAGEGRNGTLSYFLASGCDSIAIAPASDLNLVGLYIESAFVRGTLDKLEVEPQFQRVGEYKSAVETFTETEFSDEAEEALDSLLDDLYGQIVEAVAEGRGIDPELARRWVDEAPYTAARALELGMVDEVLYPDEFEERVTGEDETWLSLENYSPRRGFGPKVAVVFAQGVIVRGSGGMDPWTQETYLGSDDLGPLLEQLAEDDAIHAVVLRIDSPGGSALASELILRRATQLAEAKPLVVSMGGLAASGGYYIASRAAHIVAEKATLTGSIGVYGGKLVTGRFQEKLGVTYDTLKRGANADFFSSVRPFSEVQAERYQSQMEALYDAFLSHVSLGREMSRDEVDAVARGRVWSGESAVALGLVDEIGGLDRAIELAATAADLDLDSVALAYYPDPPSLFDFFQRGPLFAQSPAELVEALTTPRAVRRLQLPEALARLSSPF